jgi:hypothetical protein
MLMTYIILWYIAGFVSCIGYVKIRDGWVTVGDVLLSLALSVCGLIITLLLVIYIMYDLRILDKRIW